ncbi:YihY/virulence factor BrkB family protein [Streptomyces sp. NPDC051597]|uniref:YihY/virulence factor BrkB family protein n=1 Tax=Streptomyces sp. NPDC051597 TaxID=3155049 RepID=UPI003432EE04
MDWLKNLPVVGPWAARLMRTHAWRSYERLDRVRWSRLAAAITFISFLALFPLLTVSAAVAAAVLTPGRVEKLQNTLAEQVPGISDQLDLEDLTRNAGTVGVVAGALLLFTGIGWIGQMRGCLRVVWDRDDEEENPFLRKLKDGGVLVGLGGAGLASFAASSIGSTAVGWAAAQLGLEHNGVGRVFVAIVAIAVAAAADFLVLMYVLTLLPGVSPPRRHLLTAGAIGAVGFELLKVLLGGYMQGVAAKSMYGAFGVPIALLLWINFTAKLLLFCAAWTATPAKKDDPSLTASDAPAPEEASAG